MDGYITLENQVTLINSIVVSTNKLIPLLQENKNLDDAIRSTVGQIFEFLSKVVSFLPEVLVSDTTHKFQKEEIIISFDKVKEDWENITDNPDEFYNSWEEFNFWWDEFYKAFQKIDTSGNTIYLSMN